MAFDIQQFRSELTGDGARPNLFEVTMSLPSGGFASTGTGLDEARKFTFFCRAAQLPGSQMGVIQVPYFGRETKVPGNRSFADWNVTIINDEDFAVRNTMEKWMNGLNSNRGNLRDPNALNSSQYGSDALVTQYSKLGSTTILKQYKMIGGWPMDIQPIDLDWNTNDTIEEYQVTFALQWWESVGDGVTT